MTEKNRVPQINMISGGVEFALFGYFLIAGIPQGGSIIPPVLMVVAVIHFAFGFSVWLRRHRRRKSSAEENT